MEILPKLEWCCVEIPVGQNTYRSILTPTQIKNEIYSDLEIGDSVNVDDKQGEDISFDQFWSPTSQMVISMLVTDVGDKICW